MRIKNRSRGGREEGEGRREEDMRKGNKLIAAANAATN